MERIKMQILVEELSKEPEVARKMMLLLQAILDEEKDFTNDDSSLLEDKAVVKVIVASHLQQLNIPINVIGYKYLKEAVVMVVENPKLVKYIRMSVYPTIAEVYETTDMAISRAIRHCIECAWKRGNPLKLKAYFENAISKKTGRPSDLGAIITIAEKISNEMENSKSHT